MVFRGSALFGIVLSACNHRVVVLQVSKMLYVFHVDTGTMLTFDMNVAMQTSVFIHFSLAVHLYAV